MRRTILILAALATAGCASLETPLDDGYQPGDMARTAYAGAGRLLALQQAWCDGGDLVAKQVLLLSMRAAVPGYPEDGLCTDIIEALGDADRDPAVSVD